MRLNATLMALAVAAATTFQGAHAHAQAVGTEASATGKGIAGGALLGAEAVMLTEAAFGVRPAWAYAVGGGIGAVAGGVGGYFVEDSSAQASILMLTGGLVLAIPTTVAILAATAYEPPADYTEDRPSDEPVAEPPQPSPTSKAPAPPRAKKDAVAHSRIHRPTSRTSSFAPPTLIDLGHASVSVPSLEVKNLYTRRELAEFGVRQGTEVRLAFLNVLF